MIRFERLLAIEGALRADHSNLVGDTVEADMGDLPILWQMVSSKGTVETPVGLRMAIDEFVRSIHNTRVLAEIERQGNELSQRSLPSSRPVVVIAGLPRTATTLLHWALALHPESDTLSHQGTMWPFVGVPEARTISSDDARARCSDRLSALAVSAPDALKLHPIAIDRPDECTVTLQAFGRSLQFAVLFDTPEYLELLSNDSDWEGRLRRLRQVYDMVLPATDRHMLVLKGPGYIGNYRAVEAAFPNAWILQVRRGFEDTMVSWCRLIATLRRLTKNEVVLAGIADLWVPYWHNMCVRAAQDIRHLKSTRLLTIESSALRANGAAQILRVAATIGLPFESRFRVEMNELMSQHEAARDIVEPSELGPYCLQRDRIRNLILEAEEALTTVGDASYRL